MSALQTIDFDNTYSTELEGFYAPWKAAKAPNPAIVQLNNQLAEELGLDATSLDTPEGAQFFAGNELPKSSAPLAQVYAGHQFGGFSQQLGDGRALLIGEVIDTHGQRRDIQLKGSGRTPFSRGGDGKAALGPVLREYLFGEAMHALGIPTTRALAAITTGEEIARDSMQPGAILVRVASSHLRVGTFQFFAARGETQKVQQLADYSIRRHFNALENDADRYLKLLHEVIIRQASLVAKWVSVGFVHGVMNTDNMTISGETIDYGPCAFMDHYDPKTAFSSIDEYRRYAYGNQPAIAQWNLTRFAETLVPLIDPDDTENAVRLATNEINTFPSIYESHWLAEMRAKLGLNHEREEDPGLINDLHRIIDGHKIDFTQLFRNLADAARGNLYSLHGQFEKTSNIDEWLDRWQARLEHESRCNESSASAMDKVNPIYIPRNHKVEEALQTAVQNSDYAPFERLLSAVSDPYEKREGLQEFDAPAPESYGPHVTFCGT